MAFLLKPSHLILAAPLLLLACGETARTNWANPADPDGTAYISSSNDNPESSSSQRQDSISSSGRSSSSEGTSSSSSSAEPSSSSAYPTFEIGQVVDARDSSTYPTTTFLGTTWLAADLHYAFADSTHSWCADTTDTTCSTRFYDGNADLDSLCPSGWHIPDSTEWAIIPAGSLSDTSVGGLDQLGLGFRPSGYRRPFLGTSNADSLSIYWSATASDSDAVAITVAAYSLQFERQELDYGLAVRCIQDP